MKVTKRGIQITLGLLWLLDAALQYQPQMFSKNFANQVVAPAGQGQPLFVAWPIDRALHIILAQPAVFNAVFATIQLIIAILILNKRTVRAGLIASIIWGLAVWFGGEGLGGLLSWQTSLLMGLPGAALLYSIIALAVMPKKRDKAKESDRPAYWLPIAWAIMWIAGGIYQLLPGQNSTADLSSMIYGMAVGAPRWLASLDTHAANLIQRIGHGQTAAQMHMTAAQMSAMSPPSDHSGWWFILLLAAAQILIGLLIFFPGRARQLALAGGIALSVVFWFIGQALGTYYSGLATDPNSAPLFILMAVAILGVTPLSFPALRRKASRHLEELTI